MSLVLLLILNAAFAKTAVIKSTVQPTGYEKILSELTPEEKKLREQDLLMLKSRGVIVGAFNKTAKVFEIRIAGEEEVGPNFAAPEKLERATGEAGLAEKMLRNPESFEETTFELKKNLELAPTPSSSAR